MRAARGVLFVFVLLLVARDSLCQDVAAAEESPEEGATLAKFFPAEPEQEEPAEAVAADGAAVEAPTVDPNPAERYIQQNAMAILAGHAHVFTDPKFELESAQATCANKFVDDCLVICRKMWSAASRQPCTFKKAELSFLRSQLLQDDRQREPSVDAVSVLPCATPAPVQATGQEEAAPSELTASVEAAVEQALEDAAPAVSGEDAAGGTVLDDAEPVPQEEPAPQETE